VGVKRGVFVKPHLVTDDKDRVVASDIHDVARPFIDQAYMLIVSYNISHHKYYRLGLGTEVPGPRPNDKCQMGPNDKCQMT
jgi:hypothetical protein